jgi:hypothetical protein
MRIPSNATVFLSFTVIRLQSVINGFIAFLQRQSRCKLDLSNYLQNVEKEVSTWGGLEGVGGGGVMRKSHDTVW